MPKRRRKPVSLHKPLLEAIKDDRLATQRAAAAEAAVAKMKLAAEGAAEHIYDRLGRPQGWPRDRRSDEHSAAREYLAWCFVSGDTPSQEPDFSSRLSESQIQYLREQFAAACIKHQLTGLPGQGAEWYPGVYADMNLARRFHECRAS